MSDQANIALIQGLRDQFDALRFPDNVGVSRLRKRGQMLIRNIFGEQTHYLAEFENIQFFALVIPSNLERDHKAFQSGRSETLHLLDAILEEMQRFGSPWEQRIPGMRAQSDRVFVVHGHDEEMKQAVARTLTTLGVKPIILHEQPDKGRTIIEKFLDYSDVGFAVVLLSPDDLA